MATAKDLYMNFKSVSVNLDAANSATLATVEFNTGMSIRGQFLWLIHLIEVTYGELGELDGKIMLALSTLPGLTAIPSEGDKGCVWRGDLITRITTSGGWLLPMPIQHSYLPPIPVAAPSMNIYARTAPDEAALQGDRMTIRIGFTTAPLSAAMYQEIQETFAW